MSAGFWVVILLESIHPHFVFVGRLNSRSFRDGRGLLCCLGGIAWLGRIFGSCGRGGGYHGRSRGGSQLAIDLRNERAGPPIKKSPVISGLLELSELSAGVFELSGLVVGDGVFIQTAIVGSLGLFIRGHGGFGDGYLAGGLRSEERRVGKECRSRWS